MTESGSSLAFKTDFNTRFKILNERIMKHQKKIKEIVFSSLLNPRRSNVYWNNVRFEIDKEYSAILREFSTWSEKEIPLKYRNASRQITKRVKRLKGIALNARSGIDDLVASQSSIQTMRALYEDALSSMASSLVAGKNNAYRITRLTQQALIEEYMIDSAVAKSMDFGNLRKGADAISSALYSKLIDATENELLVQAGSKRYKPNYYAELVARSKFHEAHSYAAIATCNNYDTDLVIISSHNTKTEICMDYEGKVFSLSGKDNRFPVLNMVPPFHPNCLHLMFPMFESAMEVDGTLKDFSDFSNGLTDRPPYPAAFIPLAKRKAA